MKNSGTSYFTYKKMKILAAVLILAIFTCACSLQQKTPAASDTSGGETGQDENLKAVSVSLPVTGQNFFFDTVCAISIYGMKKMSTENAEEAVHIAFEECRRYEELLSRTKQGSEIWRINHSGGEPVPCSAETLEVIGKGLVYGEITGGRFDITIGPAEDLWDFHRDDGEEHYLPEAVVLADAMQHVDYRKVILDKEAGTVRLEDPLMELDLGGIAKGYIADQLCLVLNRCGVSSAIVNLGGNIACIGGKASDAGEVSPFRIGVETPYSDRTEIAGSMEMVSATAVTSGIYERYITVNGKEYHHILDAKTGYPAQSDVVGVTVTGPLGRSMECDALSTSCLLLGTEEGMKLIEEMSGFEAVFIDDSGEIHCSSGMKFTPVS